jgi:hypothetical protein
LNNSQTNEDINNEIKISPSDLVPKGKTIMSPLFDTSYIYIFGKSFSDVSE